MRKFLLKFVVLGIAIFILVAGLNTNFNSLFSLPNTAIVSNSDIAFLNEKDIFGKTVTVNLSDIKVAVDKNTTAKMWVKLFGIIPIKQIEVQLTKGEEVYLGGIPLGFSIKTNGLLVVGNNSVIPSETDAVNQKTSEIKNGDILLKINDTNIISSEDVPKILSEIKESDSVSLTILRGGEKIVCEVVPEFDIQSGVNKIGLWVKNDANGVGTLTFVKLSDSRFGALGHAITDYETGVEIPVHSGKIYKCSQVGITKAEKNTPGELRCVFLQGINTKGTIEKNTPFGVFGEITDLPSVVDYNRTAEIGSRLTVRTGKAKIISAVSGVREEYDIEIIKTMYQPESDDKSLIFRVTDKRLLALTGGIVQGMSGSPIIQNGKLIGAITHVFVSDPTKGYGIYSDFMSLE